MELVVTLAQAKEIGFGKRQLDAICNHMDLRLRLRQDVTPVIFEQTIMDLLLEVEDTGEHVAIRIMFTAELATVYRPAKDGAEDIIGAYVDGYVDGYLFDAVYQTYQAAMVENL